MHEEGVNGGFGFELAVGEVVVLPLVEEGGDLLHYGLHVGLDEISNEDKFELINKA